MPQLPNMIADIVGQPAQPAFPNVARPPRPNKGAPVPYRALLLSYAQRDNWPNFIRAQYGLPPAGGGDLIDPDLQRNLAAQPRRPRSGVAAPPIGVAPPERPAAPLRATDPFPLMSAIAAGRSPGEAFAMPVRPAAQQQDLPALFRSNLGS